MCVTPIVIITKFIYELKFLAHFFRHYKNDRENKNIHFLMSFLSFCSFVGIYRKYRKKICKCMCTYPVPYNPDSSDNNIYQKCIFNA